MAGAQDDASLDSEIAVLILNYICSKGWTNTVAALKREAKTELGVFATTQDEVSGVKTLQEVIGEYIEQTARLAQLDELKASNPIAASLLNVIDFHVQQQAEGNATACYAPPPPQPATMPQWGITGNMMACDPAQYMHSAPPQQQQQQPVAEQPAPLEEHDYEHYCGNDDYYDYNNNDEPAAEVAAAEPSNISGKPPSQHPWETKTSSQPANDETDKEKPTGDQQPQITPGRQVQRKRNKPKKRKKLDGDFAATTTNDAVPGTGNQEDKLHSNLLSPTGSLLNVLNMRLDEEGLAHLLEDDGLQSRFASGLAQHITTAMNNQEKPTQQPVRKSSRLRPAENANANTDNNNNAPAASDKNDDNPDESELFRELDLDAVLADLPGDPQMLEMLQTFVKPAGLEGGGSPLGKYSDFRQHDDMHMDYDGGEYPTSGLLGDVVVPQHVAGAAPAVPSGVVVCGAPDVGHAPPPPPPPPIVSSVVTVGVMNLPPEHVANLINATLNDINF